MLHRRALAVGLAVLLSAGLIAAQRSSKTGARLRAIALLELAANGHARLVPIAIKVDNKYYDAGLYSADPYPMALGQGTVYEAERAGSSVGLFTVTALENVKKVWTGVGQWRLNTAPELETKKAKTEPPAGPDERPVLRRSRPAAGETKPPATAPESNPAATKAGTHASGGSATSSSSGSVPADADSERPILRRGKPSAQASNDVPASVTPGKPAAATRLPAITAPAGPVEVLVAVSDANGSAPHSFVMPLSAEQQSRDQAMARQMAYEAIAKFAATRPPHRPAPATALTAVQFKAYDAQTNNECTMVLSASLPELSPRGAASNFRYFVTVVGRIDMYGEAHSLLAKVSDSTHLDAYPRMELVDIVDAEGTGTGQLLFRQISDTGYNYVLYRVGLDKLWPLFEGAGKNF